jgi:hypothetical protein
MVPRHNHCSVITMKIATLTPPQPLPLVRAGTLDPSFSLLPLLREGGLGSRGERSEGTI